MHNRFLPVLARAASQSLLASAASVVAACGGGTSGGAPQDPNPIIEVLAPLTQLDVDAGVPVEVRFVVSGVSTATTTRVSAELIFGVGPDLELAAGLSAPPGVEVAVVWDTTGAVDGVYRIVVEGSLGSASAQAIAPGRVYLGTLAAPPGLVTEGGAGFIWPRAVASGSDGSLVLLAQLRPSLLEPARFGVGTPNEVSLTSTESVADLVVARYGPDGALAWVRRSEGELATESSTLDGGPLWTMVEPAAAVCLPDGSCAVLAAVHGLARFGVGEPSETLVNAPTAVSDQQALVLLRYTFDGSLAWARVLSPQTRGFATPRIVALPDGRVAIHGSLDGVSTPSIVLGAGEPGQVTIPVSAAARGYLAVYEADGRLAFAQPFPRAGLNSNGHIGALAASATGELFVTGWCFGTVLFGAPGPGEVTVTAPGAEQRVFVARLTAEGELDWVRVGESPSQTYTEILEVVTRPGGGVALTGVRCCGPLSFDVGLPSQLDFGVAGGDGSLFLLELDADGRVIWGRDTGIEDPQAYGFGRGGLFSLEDGGLLLADGLESQGTPLLVLLDPSGPNPIGVTVAEDVENIVVLRYDDQGALAWAFVDGGDSVDETQVRISGLALRADGAFTVAAFVEDGPALFGAGGPNATPVPMAGSFNGFEPIALATYAADGSLLPTAP